MGLYLGALYSKGLFFPIEKFLTSSLRCKIPFMQALLIVCAQNMELPITGLLLSFAIISEESQEFYMTEETSSKVCQTLFTITHTWALLLSDILSLFD